MAYLSGKHLREMGFKKLGKGVKVSDRASVYNASCIELGDYSRIDDFCVVSGKVVIGRNVHIASLCLDAGGDRGIIFDDFSGIAYQVQGFTQSDDYSGGSLTNPTVPKDFKNEIKVPVYVGRHCIVGACSIVMPGVRLNEGTAMGAMSLVRKSTEAWSIYAGNPEKKSKIGREISSNLKDST